MSYDRSFGEAGSVYQGDCTMADEQLSLILVTAPSLEIANQLAHGLVTKRLAACVTVLPQVM
jgi:CutA1 divalent ion tolerance protein